MKHATSLSKMRELDFSIRSLTSPQQCRQCVQASSRIQSSLTYFTERSHPRSTNRTGDRKLNNPKANSTRKPSQRAEFFFIAAVDYLAGRRLSVTISSVPAQFPFSFFTTRLNAGVRGDVCCCFAAEVLVTGLGKIHVDGMLCHTFSIIIFLQLISVALKSFTTFWVTTN